MNKTTQRILIGVIGSVVGIIAIVAAAFIFLRGNSWTKEDVDRVEDKYMYKSDSKVIEEFGKPTKVENVNGAVIDRTYKIWDNTKLDEKNEKVMLTLIDDKIYAVTSGTQSDLNDEMERDKSADKDLKASAKELEDLLQSFDGNIKDLDLETDMENAISKDSNGKYVFDAKKYFKSILKENY